MNAPQVLDPQTPPARTVAEIKRAPIVTQDHTVLLDTAKFEQIQRVAAMMAQMKLMPEHLRGSAADCAMVVEQAWRWQMSPTAVASKTYSVSGKLAYEGQLVAAVVNTRAGLKGRLNYRFTGEFDRQTPQKSTLKVICSGTMEGEDEPRDVEVAWVDGFAMSKGAQDKWKSQPQQQLSYFAARVWARRHTPEVLLGVYTAEELEAEARHIGPDHARDVTPPRPQRSDYVGESAAVAAEPEPQMFDLVDEVGEVVKSHSPGEFVDELRRHLTSAKRPFEAKVQILANNAGSVRLIDKLGLVHGFEMPRFIAWLRETGFDVDDDCDPIEAEEGAGPVAGEYEKSLGGEPAEAEQPTTFDLFEEDGQQSFRMPGAESFLSGLLAAIEATMAENRSPKKLWDANAAGRADVRHAGDPKLVERLEALQKMVLQWKPAKQPGKLV